MKLKRANLLKGGKSKWNYHLVPVSDTHGTYSGTGNLHTIIRIPVHQLHIGQIVQD